VETRGSDEIAQLSHDVNQLAHALSENRSARQRWMADMAHELRTPLSIIQGELEAVSDGVRPLNETSLSSIGEEVSNLKKLVDDLRHLALSDSGALAYDMHPVPGKRASRSGQISIRRPSW
jgi:two-component system sensor histidine kinase BaeS